jgi:thioester reductase-like protein
VLREHGSTDANTQARLASRGYCARRPATERFRAAVQDAKIGPDKDIPHVPPRIIVKYITNLDLLGLL